METFKYNAIWHMWANARHMVDALIITYELSIRGRWRKSWQWGVSLPPGTDRWLSHEKQKDILLFSIGK